MLAYGSLADDLTGAIALDLHFNKIALDVGKVGRSDITIVVNICNGLLIIRECRCLSKRSLKNGSVHDGNITVAVKITVLELVGSGLNLIGIEIYYVQYAGLIEAGSQRRSDVVAVERSIGSRGVSLVGTNIGKGLGDVGRELLTGLEVDMRGNDRAVEAGDVILDPSLAGNFVTGLALIRNLSIRVGVVEHDVASRGRNGNDKPLGIGLIGIVVHLGLISLTLVSPSAERLVALIVISVAVDPLPALCVVIMHLGSGVGQLVVVEVEGSRGCRVELVDSVLGNSGGVELIALYACSRNRERIAVLQAILHRSLDLCVGSSVEEVDSQVSGADLSGVIELNGDVLTCGRLAGSSITGSGGLGGSQGMVEQDRQILRSTPGLTLFILELFGLSLAVRTGSGITGIMLNGQVSRADSGLGVVAERRGVNEDDAAPCGNAVGTGSGAQRSGACLSAVSDDVP